MITSKNELKTVRDRRAFYMYMFCGIMSRLDHAVTPSDFVSHFKEVIDRFLRNFASGSIYHPIERNWSHFGPAPLPTEMAGGKFDRYGSRN